MRTLDQFHSAINKINYFTVLGKVISIKASRVEALGIKHYLTIGSKCELVDKDTIILLEVIGFEGEKIILMALDNIDGISLKEPMIRLSNRYKNYIYPDKSWLGNILNGFGESISVDKPLKKGKIAYKIQNHPPQSIKRKKLGSKIETGIKAIDCFTSCCKGQKLGIIAPSGVGKSVLISMLAKNSKADVKIIALIGERSKEVKEFLDHYSQSESLKNSILIFVTSDQSSLVKINATYLTLAISEYFRDQGNDVLCVIDSMTRFAFAQREVGLTLGEYPTTRGYTPSALSSLPKIIERAGPGEGRGSITAFFTILEEEENDILSEIMKSFLDGHILLEREIANRRRFPAINVIKSISRSMPYCNSKSENYKIESAKKILIKYSEIEELIKLGLYKQGSNEEFDRAIKYYPKIEQFLFQNIDEKFSLEESFTDLGI